MGRRRWLRWDEVNQSGIPRGTYPPDTDSRRKLLIASLAGCASSGSQIDATALAAGEIFVIANALLERNVDDWSLPNYLAFSVEELAALEEWVRDGGFLLLIADHMPMPAATSDLASAFVVRFGNGYAVRAGFDRENGSLADHPVNNGRGADERVTAVATFTGQAFKADGDYAPLLFFGPSAEMLFPDNPAVFTAQTRRIDIQGWCQGVVLKHGEGGVAVFGEAAMFSAQTRNSGGADETARKRSRQAESFIKSLFMLATQVSDLVPARF